MFSLKSWSPAFFSSMKIFSSKFPTFSLQCVLDGYLNSTHCNPLPLRLNSFALCNKIVCLPIFQYICLYVWTLFCIRAFCSSSLPAGHPNSRRAFALREGTYNPVKRNLLLESCLLSLADMTFPVMSSASLGLGRSKQLFLRQNIQQLQCVLYECLH